MSTKTVQILFAIIVAFHFIISDDIIPCSDVFCSPFATCYNKTFFILCKCNKGFRGNGMTCNDKNECTSIINKHSCDKNADCINLPGNYSCQCHPGYTGDGYKCEYLDECANNSHNCHQDAVCTNTDSQIGFNCTCKEGFHGNETHCTDINECLIEDVCPDHSSCHNMNGSYTCPCDQGFKTNGSVCQDINECFKTPNICQNNKTCINLYGSYSCICMNTICADYKDAKEKTDTILLIGIVVSACVMLILVVASVCIGVYRKRRLLSMKTIKHKRKDGSDNDIYKTIDNNSLERHHNHDVTTLHLHDVPHTNLSTTKSLPRNLLDEDINDKHTSLQLHQTHIDLL